MTKETMTNTPLPAGAIRAANAVDDCFGAIESGICKPEHIAAIIHNSGPKEMVEALQAMLHANEAISDADNNTDLRKAHALRLGATEKAERALNRYLKGE